MEFNITVNRNSIKAVKGETILAVLRRNGISVPTLCNIPELSPTGACRICVVELEDSGELVTACSTPVAEGMKIFTHSRKVIAARKTIVELLLTNHQDNCLYCEKSGDCELQDLAGDLNIRERSYVGFGVPRSPKTDRSDPGIVRDMSKCILCGRCVRICEELLGVCAIDFVNRGNNIAVDTVFQKGLFYSNCIHCGLCITACPTGAILEKAVGAQVCEKIDNKDKNSTIILAGSTIADLALHFNIRKFEDARNYLVAALHDIGFNNVLTLGYGNEIFITEHAKKLAMSAGKQNPPLIISDCPAVRKFIRTEMPDMEKYLSKIPTPQQIMGKILKSGESQTEILVSASACVAHKYEAVQNDNSNKGAPDVDYVITTRELLGLLKTHGVVLPYKKKESPDKPSGSETSAGVLFETKGGISETILRELFYMSGGQKYPKKIFEVKTDKPFIEYEFELNGVIYKIASLHGIDTLRQKKNEIINGSYLFVEIRSCTAGCLNGCGHLHSKDPEVQKKLKKIITEFDETNISDTAGKNPFIKGFYKQIGKESLFDYD